MNVLSLFDGMSCGQIALHRADIKYKNYYASEIDPYAMAVTQHNYPQTVQVGDVAQLTENRLPKVDLLIGGSPCQGFSWAGKKLNFDDPRSKLFFEYVRLLGLLKPKYFLLENVRMANASKAVISKELGVEPVVIDSALVSAQKRVRLYWTNIPYCTIPADKGVLLKDITDNGENFCLNDTYKNYPKIYAGKSCTLRAGRSGFKVSKKKVGPYRAFKIHEIEKLQTVPDGYTDCISSVPQRYRMLGNGWTVDVIAHIFKGLKG